MITYIFRKRTPTGFSIEKLFDGIFRYGIKQDWPVEKLELPKRTSSIWSVISNVLHTRSFARPGIIHITGDVHYAALLNYKNKVIITIHDVGMVLRKKGLLKFVFWLIWFRLPLPKAKAITVISEKTRHELLEQIDLPKDIVHVIPNFVNPKYEFTKKEFNSNSFRILHIGTNDNKNLPRVIQALEGLGSKLIIIGKISNEIKIKLDHCLIDYENKISLTEDELHKVYIESDIISFPSTFEGFGMPILEGQAIGRPVLTSNIEPMTTVAGSNGALFVDPFSVMEIRQGFIKLIKNEDLRNKIVAAGIENAKKYSLENIAQKYKDLYESLN